MEGAEFARYCRVSAIWSSETSRIQIYLTDPAATKHLEAAMSLIGAVRKMGQAPPTALERTLQKALTDDDSK